MNDMNFQLPDDETFLKQAHERDAERRSTLGALGYEVIDMPGGEPKIIKKPTAAESITDSSAWATKGWTQNESGKWIQDKTTDTSDYSLSEIDQIVNILNEEEYGGTTGAWQKNDPNQTADKTMSEAEAIAALDRITRLVGDETKAFELFKKAWAKGGFKQYGDYSLF